MEAMDKRKKDRLIKGITLNAIILFGCLAYVLMYIIPQYTLLDETIAQVNSTITSTAKLQSDGVNKDTFTELLNKSDKKKEIPDIILTDSAKLDEVLKKPAGITKDYLNWIMDENGKINTLDKEIKDVETILGNIIPVFISSSNTNIDDNMDNQITLASFISYIEKDILGRYSLTSYAPLGISNITFPEKNNTSVNIGSFKVTLDFKGKNSNILNFIDTIQKSGSITIRNGKIIGDATETTPSKKQK